MSDFIGNLSNVSLANLSVGDYLGDAFFLNPTSQINPTNQIAEILRSHGIYNTEPISNPPSWTGIDGLSLWLYDNANNINTFKTLFSSQVNETTFKTAFEKLLAMGSPTEILSYSLEDGDYILGTEGNNTLNGGLDTSENFKRQNLGKRRQ